MKKITLYSLLLAVAFLIQGMSSPLLGATTATLNVTAGNLSLQLGSMKDSITNLVLTGEINAIDINNLRSMAKLTELNLEGVSIVAGGSFNVVGIDQSTAKNQIPGYMFYDRVKLTSVLFPNNITVIGNYAFYTCSGLSSVTIPNSVTTIGDFAFHDCLRITSIKIGDGVNSIGQACFCGGYRLKEFIVSENNTSFCSIDGILFNKNKDRFVHFPNQKSTNYIIPDGVTTIEDHAFCGCTSLTSITIPSSLTKVGFDAFYDCSGLKEINCNSSLPPSLFSESFFNVNKGACVLNVPIGSSATYRTTPYWSDFTNIVEKGPMPISKTNTNQVSVYTKQNCIILQGVNASETISVYSTLGVLLKTIKTNENETKIEVPAKQVYIIKLSDRTFKVVL